MHANMPEMAMRWEHETKHKKKKPTKRKKK